MQRFGGTHVQLIDPCGLNLPLSHVFYSRVSSFKQGVLRITDGKGVDVVFNSLNTCAQGSHASSRFQSFIVRDMTLLLTLVCNKFRTTLVISMNPLYNQPQ